MTLGITLLAGIMALNLLGSYIVTGLEELTVRTYQQIGSFELTPENAYSLMLRLFASLIMLVGPIMVAVVVTGVVSHVAQDNGRLDFQWGRITFSLDKLNPITGLNKIFNKDALMEIVKSMAKILIIGWIAYRVIQDEMQNITILAESDVSGILSYTGHVAFKIVTHTCGIMLLMAILDLAYVRWRYTDNLKMTKQEVKDEHKESDGNPEIKGKIKNLQYQAAKRRLITIIPTADVVITNPTHYAVAVKYERNRMMAPLVIAKGVDEMALAIRELAKEHKIALVENRPLARELFEKVPENHEIPETLYAAVAEVLAYVYRMKGVM